MAFCAVSVTRLTYLRLTLVFCMVSPGVNSIFFSEPALMATMLERKRFLL